jgi:hypothetical protein
MATSTSNQQYIIDEGMAKATADALLLETYSSSFEYISL